MKNLLVLFILLIIFPVNAYQQHSHKWLDEYDGYHNCIREWWNIDAFIQAEKNYSITASFEYEKETPAANLFFTVFDWDEKKAYDCGSYGDGISTIHCSGKYEANISYGKSWLRGAYPRYKVHFENKGIIVDMEIHAEARAVFVAEGEGGILPMGLGYYRYMFIPKCRATGWIFIDGKLQEFTGVAYYEHVWGNWSYHTPLKGCTIKPYISLAKWWWENKNISFHSISFSSNNPFGYDWAWMSFDNGWSMFYGVIPFWVEEIPFGIAYLYDGEKVVEMGGINYEYLDGIIYGDVYIPTKIKVDMEGEGKLSLVMEMDNEAHVYEDKLRSIYWKKLILYECPGKISGYYEKDGQKLELRGRCEIEIERQVSVLEYLSLKIVPEKNGVRILFLSCLLGVAIELQISFSPFSINFSFSHIG